MLSARSRCLLVVAALLPAAALYASPSLATQSPSQTFAASPAGKNAATKAQGKRAKGGGAPVLARNSIGMPVLSEEEARRALDRELSLKVGKHMREDDYPPEARQQRWTGTALIEVLVARDGFIKQVDLARTSGFAILDERALAVVRRVPKLFVPFQLRGGEQRARVPIAFSLQD